MFQLSSANSDVIVRRIPQAEDFELNAYDLRSVALQRLCKEQ
jgi:hypothetical protein